MRRSLFEDIAILVCLGAMIYGLSGCGQRTSYTIKWSYVCPVDSKEVRTIDGEVNEHGITNKTILVNFPRTLQKIHDEMIWRFKK